MKYFRLLLKILEEYLYFYQSIEGLFSTLMISSSILVANE
ncbi:hypothetical protein RB653_001847 [Dictyostelium firmibasis]|uniref:Uncharacterized protein n=1 Tax=Dictyostelium firmibasis TaxID=79012 RepID=A0AAN7TXK9_9MYCE